MVCSFVSISSSEKGTSERSKRKYVPIWHSLKISKVISNQFIWMSLCKLYCSSKTALPLSYILTSTFCFSFVHSGLVWPVSAQIFILNWHITAHNILRKRVSWYITLTFEQQNLFFSLSSGVAALPGVIKAQGRLERHNYVWIDSWLSCPCLEAGWLSVCGSGLSSPHRCDRRVPACALGRAGPQWCQVCHHVSQGWGTGWSVLDGKTKALLSAKDILRKVGERYSLLHRKC